MNKPVSITRRSFLRHVPLAAAAAGTAVTTGTMAKPVFVRVGSPTLPPATPEHPNDKVRRLGREIMMTLREPNFIGFDRITVTPQHVSYGDEPDDELIELAQRFKALVAAAYAAQSVAYEEQARARETFLSLGGKSLDADWDEFSDFYDNSPAGPADDAMHLAWERVDEVGNLIRSKPARGLGGVWAKLVALQCDHGYRDAIPRRDQDLTEERFNTLLDEIGASAGLT